MNFLNFQTEQNENGTIKSAILWLANGTNSYNWISKFKRPTNKFNNLKSIISPRFQDQLVVESKVIFSWRLSMTSYNQFSLGIRCNLILFEHNAILWNEQIVHPSRFFIVLMNNLLVLIFPPSSNASFPRKNSPHSFHNKYHFSFEYFF